MKNKIIMALAILSLVACGKKGTGLNSKGKKLKLLKEDPGFWLSEF